MTENTQQLPPVTHPVNTLYLLWLGKAVETPNRRGEYQTIWSNGDTDPLSECDYKKAKALFQKLKKNDHSLNTDGFNVAFDFEYNRILQFEIQVISQIPKLLNNRRYFAVKFVAGAGEQEWNYILNNGEMSYISMDVITISGNQTLTNALRYEHVPILWSDQVAQYFLETICVPVKNNILTAKKNISIGMPICQYYGFLTSTRPHEVSCYDFKVKGNTTVIGVENSCFAVSLSHSCDPNCEFDVIDQQKGVVVITTLKAVKKGEELTVHDGPNFETLIGGKKNCLCILIVKVKVTSIGNFSKDLEEITPRKSLHYLFVWHEHS